MDDEEVGADEFQLIGGTGNGQIQFIKSDSPDAIAERIFAIMRRINTDYLHLGREIYLVFWRKTYLKWGYSTFDECMAAKFGISRERADRVKRVWAKFIKDLGIKHELLEGVGFARAFAMLPIINSDNANDLIERAKNTRTAKAFNDHVDLLRGKPKAVAQVRETADLIEETTTEHNHPVASASGRLQVQPEETERPTKVTFNLYASQREIIDAAIQEVQRNKTGGGHMAPNEALAHVALGFLADRQTRDERPNAQVRFYLNGFERIYGGKFVWIVSDEAAQVLTKAIEEHPTLFPQQGSTAVNPEEIEDEHQDGQDDGAGGRFGERSDGHGGAAQGEEGAVEAGGG